MGRPIITLSTDFGSRFSYVAEMKGVILDALDGDVELVDVTHDIEPQSIAEAELVVARLLDTFPLGTTHLVVVDPGVGTTGGLSQGHGALIISLVPIMGFLAVFSMPRTLMRSSLRNATSLENRCLRPFTGEISLHLSLRHWRVDSL